MSDIGHMPHMTATVEVQPDHFSYRSVADIAARPEEDGRERYRAAIRECLKIMADNGMVEWRVTENPDGYKPGIYVEGWNRKLRFPERQADFNYPTTYGIQP